MPTKKMIVFMCMLICTVGLFTSLLSSEAGCACNNSDDCGKIVGQLIDAESNRIILKPFVVGIYRYYQGAENKYLHQECGIAETSTGHFSISLKSGKYYILAYPRSNDGNYSSMYFDPRFPQKEIQPITVERGKITKIQKKIKKCGELKITLKNANGAKINFRDFFKVGEVNVALTIENIGYQLSMAMHEKELASGEMIIKYLMPNEYQLSYGFYHTGFGDTKTEKIKIESNKTTIYEIIINPIDNTGIQGHIRTNTGVAIKIGEIELYKDIEGYGMEGFATAIPDENGYYKIFGVPEGNYSLRVECEYDELNFSNIIIKKDELLSKDIVVQVK
jgi:hypothetical protein